MRRKIKVRTLHFVDSIWRTTPLSNPGIVYRSRLHCFTWLHLGDIFHLVTCNFEASVYCQAVNSCIGLLKPSRFEPRSSAFIGIMLGFCHNVIVFIALFQIDCLYAATAASWRTRSIYQVFTDRFALTDSSTSAPCSAGFQGYCGGSWKGTIDKLDYIQVCCF